MKALSIKQPWADLIIFHGKNVENRSWFNESFTGPMLIHASKSVDTWAMKEYDFKKDEVVLGAFVGMVDVLSYTDESSSTWAVSGQWHWMLNNPKPIEPIEWKGNLGLWNAPECACIMANATYLHLMKLCRNCRHMKACDHRWKDCHIIEKHFRPARYVRRKQKGMF